MTYNPIAARRAEQAAATQVTGRYGTQEWCDNHNSQLRRSDVEWVIDGRGGCYLRDKREWMAEQSRMIAKRHAEDQQRFLRASRNPVKTRDARDHGSSSDVVARTV